MTADERTAYQLAVTTILTPLTVIVDLMQELEEKTADFPLILAAQLPLILAAIKRAKTSAACTPAILTSLEWIGLSQNNDPETSRPTIELTPQPGRVKIEGRKPGFDSVSIYSRKKGEVQWKLIAVRKRKFPGAGGKDRRFPAHPGGATAAHPGRDQARQDERRLHAGHPDQPRVDRRAAKQRPRDLAPNHRANPATRPGKDRRPPYYDESPLAVANTPEVREYVAHGVVDDEEVGEPSEIKEVVFAG